MSVDHNKLRTDNQQLRLYVMHTIILKRVGLPRVYKILLLSTSQYYYFVRYLSKKSAI